VQTHLEPLGPVVRLQVQVGHLKAGSPRRYDPGPITPVVRLVVDPDGVTGYTAEGVAVHDVHHRLHPRSRHRGGNGISVGFTGHYRAMRERFGEAVADGVAGENLIVDDYRIHLGMAVPFVIFTATGPVRLTGVTAAPPCVEFTRYCLDMPPDEPDDRVAAGLRFLGGGMRGYYLRLADGMAGTAEIGVGDHVFATG
jgi:hypothetical protein